MYYYKNKFVLIIIIIFLYFFFIKYNFICKKKYIEHLNTCKALTCNNNFLYDLDNKYCYKLSYIKHVKSNKYLIVSTNNNNNISFTDDINIASVWKFVKYYDNFYKIINKDSNKVLDCKNNIDITIEENNDDNDNNDSQFWKCNYLLDNYYNLQWKKNFNKCLDSNGNNVYIHDIIDNNFYQYWNISLLSKFINTPNLVSCTKNQYINIDQNKCIDLCVIKHYKSGNFLYNTKFTGRDDNVITYTNDINQAKMWKLIPLEYDYYKIVSNNTNQLLTGSSDRIYGYYPDTNHDDLIWKLIKKNECYFIVNKNSNSKCLDSNGNNTYLNNTNYNNDYQKWIILCDIPIYSI